MKDNKKISCVYKMKIGRDFYIGGTTDFEKRKCRHLYDLKNETHPSKKAQLAFFTSIEEPEFSIIELVSETNVEKREHFYLRTLRPTLNTLINYKPKKKSKQLTK